MPDKENCEFPLCKYNSYRDGFCIHHAKHFAGPKPVKVNASIPKVSKKVKKDNRTHAEIKKEYLKEHPVCECNRKECKKGKAVDIHHKAGRGKNLNNIETFLAVSRACHLFIESHPSLSKELGLSHSRLNKSATIV